MPTPVENFLANPIAFMSANVVTVDVNLPTGGVYRFKLEAKAGYTASLEGTGAAAGVYSLQRENSLVGSFEAYWLPYDNNKMFHLELRNQAKFMFTPRMDGCTFAANDFVEKKGGFLGVFSSKKHFAHVSHSNMQDNQGEVDQPLINYLVKQVHGTPKTKVLKRGDYLDPVESVTMGRETVYKLTTFGVRRSGKWKFYSQAYRDMMGDYRLASLTRL